MYIYYSLVAGVSFDLFDSLYKPDAPKTTTVHVSDTHTDMLHCNKVGLCPRASCTYTSQSTQWGVITNTYMYMSIYYICKYSIVYPTHFKLGLTN